MIARDFAQRHIDRLDSIGGVDRLANVLWEREQWDHAAPVGSPRLADVGIERIPFLSKEFQIKLGFGDHTLVLAHIDDQAVHLDNRIAGG